MTLTEGQIEIMKEDISAELICLLMQNWHFSQQEAVDILYNSDTFNRLQDEQTGFSIRVQATCAPISSRN